VQCNHASITMPVYPCQCNHASVTMPVYPRNCVYVTDEGKCIYPIICPLECPLDPTCQASLFPSDVATRGPGLGTGAITAIVLCCIGVVAIVLVAYRSRRQETARLHAGKAGDMYVESRSPQQDFMAKGGGGGESLLRGAEDYNAL
jgi:hypothetical protein